MTRIDAVGRSSPSCSPRSPARHLCHRASQARAADRGHRARDRDSRRSGSRRATGRHTGAARGTGSCRRRARRAAGAGIGGGRRAGARCARCRNRLRNNVYAGTRAEELASLAAEIPKAQARLDYAQAQLKRISQLARDDYASRQSLDQAEADARRHAPTSLRRKPTRRGKSGSHQGSARHSRRTGRARCRRACRHRAAAGKGGAQSTRRWRHTRHRGRGRRGRSGRPAGADDRSGAKPWLSFNAREDSLRGLSVGQTVHVQIPHGAAPSRRR